MAPTPRPSLKPSCSDWRPRPERPAKDPLRDIQCSVLFFPRPTCPRGTSAFHLHDEAGRPTRVSPRQLRHTLRPPKVSSARAQSSTTIVSCRSRISARAAGGSSCGAGTSPSRRQGSRVGDGVDDPGGELIVCCDRLAVDVEPSGEFSAAHDEPLHVRSGEQGVGARRVDATPERVPRGELAAWSDGEAADGLVVAVLGVREGEAAVDLE